MNPISHIENPCQISCYSILDNKEIAVEKVFECYKEDKLLIRSLYSSDTENRFEFLEWELDELIQKSERKSSSVSYIPYKIPMYPLGRMGILLDLEKCNLEGLYKSDAAVSRVDLAGRHISWSRPLKTYVLWEDENVSVSDPDIKHEANVDDQKYKVKSIEDIKSYMQEESFFFKPVNYNEVVVGYKKESIIGIAALINNAAGRGRNTNEKIIADSVEFKSILSDRLDKDVPILIYDCSNGELSLST